MDFDIAGHKQERYEKEIECGGRYVDNDSMCNLQQICVGVNVVGCDIACHKQEWHEKDLVCGGSYVDDDGVYKYDDLSFIELDVLHHFLATSSSRRRGITSTAAEFDKTYDPTWHHFAGRNVGSYNTTKNALLDAITTTSMHLRIGQTLWSVDITSKQTILMLQDSVVQTARFNARLNFHASSQRTPEPPSLMHVIPTQHLSSPPKPVKRCSSDALHNNMMYHHSYGRSRPMSFQVARACTCTLLLQAHFF